MGRLAQAVALARASGLPAVALIWLRETPWGFANELLPPDLDRIAGSLEVGFRHFPPLERAGIKRVVNGPKTRLPRPPWLRPSTTRSTVPAAAVIAAATSSPTPTSTSARARVSSTTRPDQSRSARLRALRRTDA